MQEKNILKINMNTPKHKIKKVRINESDKKLKRSISFDDQRFI
jgi:hypothetical protein